MSRKKYGIIVKMVKEINMKLAIQDVKTIINNSTKESLNEIFNVSPKFIYSVRECR